jgi:hypothetical protein
LIQIDGSDHRWFEQRGESCTLLVFIDHATSRLMQLRFVLSESTYRHHRHRSTRVVVRTRSELACAGTPRTQAVAERRSDGKSATNWQLPFKRVK